MTQGPLGADDGVDTATHAVTVHDSEELRNGSIRWFAPKKYRHAATLGLRQSIEGPTVAFGPYAGTPIPATGSHIDIKGPSPPRSNRS